MPLPTNASLDTAGAATDAPSIDEAGLTTYLKALRDHVEALRTSLINNGTLLSVPTATLAAVGNAINTTGKTLSKSVFNPTTGGMYAASGTTAAAPWTAVAPETSTAITPV